MKKILLACFASLLSIAAFAQTGTVKGRVVDAENGEGLVGANVILEGTTIGVMTDINGNFVMEDIQVGEQVFVASYVGFLPENVEAVVKPNAVTELGIIKLGADAIGLQEVEVLASLAQERETPVAVSNISAEIIEAKIGNQEFPEILKTTPGVYATKQGGGYGDSRINLRGFSSENVAVLINGIPVNDMENGRVYWSNWAGLSDVTRTMQVQRGLGASKVAVPSVGGTINILTRTTDAQKGGNIFYGVGNDGYEKVAFGVSTGLTENGWAISASGSRTTGDGYIDGTAFEGYSYFLNVSKIINEDHTLSLTGFGAPQWHGQRQNRSSIVEYLNAPQGFRFNPDWGYLNGQVVNVEDNFYHKPQFSLNHYWTISDRTELATAAYASTGTGGGGGTGGETSKFSDVNNTYRIGQSPFGAYNLDLIFEENAANAELGSETILRASRNDHQWYGVLSSLDHELSETITLLGGLDLRYYKGDHFQEVTNLLGGDYFVDEDSDVNNPNARIREGEIFSYHDNGIVLWEGIFAQAEYSQDKVSAFLSLSASNTSYKRIDYFNYLDTDPERETPYQNFLGYSAKGGVNYNLNERHNVFANLGYFEKAPDFDAVFQNFRNDINEGAVNQKIVSYELGYGYRSSVLSGNVNLYRTNWRDRTLIRTVPGRAGEDFFVNVQGVNALHQGVEVDFTISPISDLRISGMASFGDWVWQNNLTDVVLYDNDRIARDTLDLYIAGLKVGDAAQTTLALTADYEVFETVNIGFTYNYYANYFASYDPLSRTTAEKEGIQAWELPDYSLLDLNLSYRFGVADIDAKLFGTVNNLLDTEYISDAFDGPVASAGVFYGFGRTWTLGMKLEF